MASFQMTHIKPIAFAACALFAGAAAVMVARSSGKNAGEASITRLQILWPSIKAFPDHDRAFLAGLAMTCRLHEKPVERLEVVACLQSASINPQTILPKGESQSDAPDKFARLLTTASN